MAVLHRHSLLGLNYWALVHSCSACKELWVLSVLFYYFLFHLHEILIADMCLLLWCTQPSTGRLTASLVRCKSPPLLSLCRRFACSFSCLTSQSSSLALPEVCKTPGSNMMRQISLGSSQCWCAVHLPLPCLPVSSWNCSKCSFKLVLLPVQIPCNRAMEMEAGILSLIRGNSVLCTSVSKKSSSPDKVSAWVWAPYYSDLYEPSYL